MNSYASSRGIVWAEEEELNVMNTGRRCSEANASHMVWHHFYHLRQNENAEQHNRWFGANLEGVASENHMVERSDGLRSRFGVMRGFKRVRVPNDFVVDNVRVQEEGVAAVHNAHHS